MRARVRREQAPRHSKSIEITSDAVRDPAGSRTSVRDPAIRRTRSGGDTHSRSVPGSIVAFLDIMLLCIQKLIVTVSLYGSHAVNPVKRRRATYQDVLDAPEHVIAEIIGGELRLSPRPGGPATVVASTLGHELGPPFSHGGGGPGGWLILDEPELHVGDEILVPDLAGWRLERMSVVPDGFFTVTPDWICEVLSPSTERLDREDKMAIYAASGIEYAWLVHPGRRTVEAFRLHNGSWTIISIHQDNDRARIEPFDAIDLDLAKLWRHVPLPTRASEPQAPYELDGW